MTLKGRKVEVKDKNGSFTFKNEISDKITLTGSGKVDLSLKNLEDILNIMKSCLENTDI